MDIDVQVVDQDTGTYEFVCLDSTHRFSCLQDLVEYFRSNHIVTPDGELVNITMPPPDFDEVGN
jgi:hypothetical protein